MKPYIDIERTDEYIIREFGQNIDPIELMWHRDDEDRLIQVIENKDWKIQLDNELPVLLDKVFIPKHKWHRLLKGEGNLKIKIIL